MKKTVKRKSKERVALGRIEHAIAMFDEKCADAEYTDVGEAWEVFEQLRVIARKALGMGPMPTDAQIIKQGGLS